MFPNLHRHQLQPRIAGLSLTVVCTTVLLTACGSPTHPAAAANTGIHPGAGQSLAGTPGATGTESAPAGATAMPGMSMSPTTGAPAAPVAGDAVAITNFAFAPAELVVKVGTTVTWTNNDADAHTVTSQGSGGPLQSKAMTTGATYTYRFTQPGTYQYLCTIHPFMTATVTVKP
jgi:plastocyanin